MDTREDKVWFFSRFLEHLVPVQLLGPRRCALDRTPFLSVSPLPHLALAVAGRRQERQREEKQLFIEGLLCARPRAHCSSTLDQGSPKYAADTCLRWKRY